MVRKTEIQKIKSEMLGSRPAGLRFLAFRAQETKPQELSNNMAILRFPFDKPESTINGIFISSYALKLIIWFALDRQTHALASRSALRLMIILLISTIKISDSILLASLTGASLGFEPSQAKFRNPRPSARIRILTGHKIVPY